jgi:hypothetical protein
MRTEEIKKEIDIIISEMQKCFDVMWSNDLEESHQVIVTEDTDEVKYNGWLERMFELQTKLK